MFSFRRVVTTVARHALRVLDVIARAVVPPAPAVGRETVALTTLALVVTIRSVAMLRIAWLALTTLTLRLAAAGNE